MDQRVEESLRALRPFVEQTPQVLIVLGSGLGGLGEMIERPVFADYADIPHFRASTAPAHRGRLIFGYLSGRPVVCMQGRIHCYEGATAAQAAYPVRVLAALGVKKMIVTNASGGINTDFEVGDLMLIDDHINFTGQNPLSGPNDEAEGPRFPDMSHAYSPRLAEIAAMTAQRLGISLRRGVYIGVTGPNYETPAEIRAFRVMGADAVGMSTVPEVITGGWRGMEVLGISLITNMAAGVLDRPLTHAEVVETGERRAAELQRLVGAIVGEL